MCVCLSYISSVLGRKIVSIENVVFPVLILTVIYSGSSCTGGCPLVNLSMVNFVGTGAAVNFSIFVLVASSGCHDCAAGVAWMGIYIVSLQVES